MGIPRFGKQLARYVFFLNPYGDARFTRCPKCKGKTSQKKLPLVIHVNDGGMVVLNKTCRYCPACDLLIAHKDEIEDHMALYFQRVAPDVAGSNYLVVGTVDRADWRRGTEGNMTPQDFIEVLHDFKNVVQFTFVGDLGPKAPRTVPAPIRRAARSLPSCGPWRRR
jgi:hypothetical protein